MWCSVHETQGLKPYIQRPHSMDLTNTLWLDSLINDLDGEGRNKRDSTERDWDGYSSPISETTGSDEAVRDDIRRRERMAEACYEV